MKKRKHTIGVVLVSALIIMMSVSGVSAADTTGVSINEENFPDKVFREYVSTEFDSDLDGILSDDEIETVIQISVGGTAGTGYEGGVTSLKGIEYFTNLKYLYCENNRGLLNLDVSKNTELAHIFLFCSGIAHLDLSNNPKLQSVSYNLLELGQIETSYDLAGGRPGFDTAKVFDCTGAEVIDGKLTNFTSTEGSYWYDCGNGLSLLVKFTHEHNFIDGVCSACGQKGIFINADNFPDEVFRNYVGWRADSNADGILSKEESEAVKGIYVYGEMGYGVIYDGGITSLKGIEYFTEIKYLKCEYNSGLKEIDISKNVKLEEVYCHYTGLKSLDVSKNTELLLLDCYNTKLTSLDVSKNIKLSELNCSATGITSLDVSKNTELITLFCATMDIADIDVSNNPKLWNLSCSYTKVSELDLSKNIALMFLYCDNTGLTGLDVSKNTQLQLLDCSNTGITELKLADNMLLTELDCSNTGITSLDVAANDRLGVLDCSDTELVSLNINNHIVRLNCSNTKLKSIATGDNEHLMELICSGTPITELDLSKSKRLWGLDCSGTPITKLDVTNNTDLMELDCSGTKITSLDVSNNVKLERLDCSDTEIASLDVSKNTALFRLYCSDTKLTSLNLSDIIEIIGYLDCSGTGITELNLENGFFSYLNCSGTKLKSLDLDNVAVYELNCSNTGINELDFWDDEFLGVLNCSNTGITSLDLTECSMLEKLYCSNTKLTSLNLKNNYDLETAEIYDNTFNIGEEVSVYDLGSSLPGFDVTKASEWSGATYDNGRLTGITPGTRVTYKYDCGNGFFAVFTLVAGAVDEEEDVSTTIYNGVDYAAVYNYEYYTAKYPEITGKALEYFVNTGMSLGHQASEEFSIIAYKSNYPDLGVAFGNDNSKYYMHYINSGKAEGRNATVVLVESDTKYYGVEYAEVYNYDYYISNNPDLKAAFGDNKAAALIHFANMGMKEGRQACENFGPKIYKFNYPELQESFGEDMVLYYHHYMDYGKDEGRNGATRDFSAYCEYEGVNYTPVYNYKDYIERNPDVFDAYGLDANAVLKHFVTVGMAEGRQGSDDFNYNIYRSNYPDLEAAFGENRAEYYHHYINSGFNEGRNAATSDYTSDTVYAGVDYADVYSYDYYVTANPDVAAAIGDNKIAILAHFVRNGMAEGRQGSAEFNVWEYMENNPELTEKFGNDLKAYYMHYMMSGAKG